MPGPSGDFTTKSPFKVTFHGTPSPSSREYTELRPTSYLGECAVCRPANGCSPRLIPVFPPLSVGSLIDSVEGGAWRVVLAGGQYLGVEWKSGSRVPDPSLVTAVGLPSYPTLPPAFPPS